MFAKKLKKKASFQPKKVVNKISKPKVEEEEDDEINQVEEQDFESGNNKSNLFEDDEEMMNDEFDEAELNEDDDHHKAFSDENAKWLKKKGPKADDDDEDDEDEQMDSDDEEFMLEFEKKAKKAAEEQAKIEEESNLELQRQLLGTIKKPTQLTTLGHNEQQGEEGEDMVALPISGELIKKENFAPVDLAAVNNRIQNILRVLSDFGKLRDPSKSRTDYIDQLMTDFCSAYGYSEFLIDKFLQLFPPQETLQFLEANEVHRPMTIRTNTLKIRRKELAQILIGRGVNLDPIKWSKVGLQIYDSQVPIGATPEYLAGYYMLQSASSFMPVMALDPKENERVLDMCAAPGGKTTYIAQMMKNTGFVFANDSNKDRCKALRANIQRLGIRNAVVSNLDGRKLPKVVGGFDRILLDAPCTGLGVISRDPSVKTQKNENDFKVCTHMQKELILAAFDMLNVKEGSGILVYSTCSISVEENEEVVNYLISKRDVEILDAGLEFGVPGFTRWRDRRFHPSLALTKRYYPHTHNMDGFYVAKIRKLSNAVKDEKGQKIAEEAPQQKGKNQQNKRKGPEQKQTGRQGFKPNNKNFKKPKNAGKE